MFLCLCFYDFPIGVGNCSDAVVFLSSVILFKIQSKSMLYDNKVWRYQRGNQNPYIEEEQTTQWPKEKVQKDKQQSTKQIHKTKDQVTWTPLIKLPLHLYCIVYQRDSLP
jgi:hypothetical protein